jgi:hypothetical protein
MRSRWIVIALVLAGPSFGARPEWKAGVAKVQITPRKPLWMMGFGARTKPSEGVLQELYAKALALEDRSGRRSVLVTTDLLGFPAAVASNIAARVAKQYGLPRERLLLNSSHTHGGPVLATPRRVLVGTRASAEQWRDIEDYTRELEGKVVVVIGAALKDLQPALLSFGHGETKFAVNRRLKTEKGIQSFVSNPEGPVDHEVPVLRVESERGNLRGLVFGYACHTTSLLADTYLFHGDYAGFAQEWLERQHPNSAAFFVQGCGGDITTWPRGTVEHARKYGEMLATAADKAVGDSVRPVRGPLTAAFYVLPLAFAPPPSRAELEARLQHRDPDYRWQAQQMLQVLDRDGRLPSDYPYPLQVWQFGQDLTFIAMAGEVVVDYALRLKKELGPEKLWVAGYSNDVFAYIPSLRVLQEGGYEGGEAMSFYVQPGPFAPSIEETIIRKIRELVERTRISPPPNAGARKQKP